MSALEEVRSSWEHFGAKDPLWGVNSNSSRRNGDWEEDAFFETGRQEIEGLMLQVHCHLSNQTFGEALDFGCGVGRLTQPLAAQFQHVTGLDISESMLDMACKGNQRSNISFIHNTTSDLSILADASVDFVLCHIVFQHMPTELTRGYLAEFARILRPGGGLVFTLPSRPEATARGMAYKLLPRKLIYRLKRARDGAVMQMNAIRHEQVLKYLADLNLDVRFLEPSHSAGPNWVAFRYFATKATSRTFT